MKIIVPKTITFFSLCISLTMNCQTALQKETINPNELSTWRTLDKGASFIDGDEFIIEETKGADGYFLISPESYEGDIVITYKVKALSESSVLIVLFSASDTGETNALTLPTKDAEGPDFWTWRTHLEHYNLTFNNVSHGGNTPFFYKNETPLKRGFYQKKAANIMEVGKWYDVEIGKTQNNVWFKLNNTMIFKQEDCNPLSGGHLLFRISGTTGENVIFAKAAIKDLVISHQ